MVCLPELAFDLDGYRHLSDNLQLLEPVHLINVLLVIVQLQALVGRLNQGLGVNGAATPPPRRHIQVVVGRHQVAGQDGGSASGYVGLLAAQCHSVVRVLHPVAGQRRSNCVRSHPEAAVGHALFCEVSTENVCIVISGNVMYIL